MAKMNSEEFATKYTEKITDNDDLLIELLEDFSDSVKSEDTEELEKLKQEVEMAHQKEKEAIEKYKARFLGAIDKAQDTPADDIEEPKEAEVIDIKEI
ncbi:MAG: hypothetical protein MJ224_01645 [archaeon]|nr:hypothetical protein [archaeon]